MNIQNRIFLLQKHVADNVTIIAVSKTKPVSAMLQAYEAGLRNFGENKAQEVVQKVPLMPSDTVWHFIGHLQTNKVKLIAPFIHLIHSVDSENLLHEINKEALKNNRIIECLLQFHIAMEETKFGLDINEAKKLVEIYLQKKYQYVKITGVMGMASYSDDNDLISSEFRELRKVFDVLKSAYFSQQDSFKVISMGMSGDYQLAMSEGSNMIRIGSSIFGDR